ncbi:hypothetical protein BLOT_014463 [Blomia tropicalis]|nr:hypothetical protein BLOT_014463 [Blomia tropicalis]
MAMDTKSNCINGNPANSSLISNPNRIKKHVRTIYLGKVNTNAPSVDITNDRVIICNIRNKPNSPRYNITIPFAEMIALRYCLSRDLSIFIIQPIQESYHKLSDWIQQQRNIVIPENFIMILFENEIPPSQFTNIFNSAKKINPRIQLIEINSAFAQSYLASPNKTCKKVKLISTTSNSAEVIDIEDDTDEETEGQNEIKQNDILQMTILKYPTNDNDNNVILSGNDLTCLKEGNFLNDNIMNFYLRYFQYSDSPLDQNIMAKIHIADTLFCNQLLNLNQRKRKVDVVIANRQYNIPIHDSTTISYENLKKWTKDVDLFSKDFVFFPLIKDSHWFLAILCYIGNMISPPEKSFYSEEKVYKPTIIYMDSLSLTKRNDITKTFQKYLKFEFENTRQGSARLHWENFQEVYASVPRQNNSYDCGIFVLHYIELFLKNPIVIFDAILANKHCLENWFDSSTLSTQRSRIRQIIFNLLPPEDAAKLKKQLVD